MGRINEPICRAGRGVAGALLVAMMIVIMVQVVSRYIFNNSISWSEELSKSLMVWTAFLVAPWGYRHGANVSIELFAEALPARIQAALRLVITALVIWIVGVFFLESLSFVARGMQSRMATLPVPTGLFYAVIPASLGGMLLVGAEMFLRDIVEIATGVREGVAPGAEPRAEG